LLRKEKPYIPTNKFGGLTAWRDKKIIKELGRRILCDVKNINFETNEVVYEDSKGNIKSDYLKDIDFLLFTGAKAGKSYRKDKEIYEGDVFLVDDEYGYTHYCQVKYDKFRAVFMLLGLTKKSDNFLLKDFYFSRLEILGNTKENPFILAELQIKETKQELKEKGYLSLKTYMEECCYRKELFELGEIVKIFHYGEKGIIVGWNGSCNYQVFGMNTHVVVNIHPADLKKDKGEIFES